mgnify:CR=1 FL=1
MEHVLETKDFFILPSLFKSISKSKYPGAKKSDNVHSYFENMKAISVKEISKMLKTIYLF